MKKIFIYTLILLCSLSNVIAQEVSDTAFIRLVELLGMESQLVRYHNKGTFSKSDEKYLVVSDFKDKPILKSSKQLPYIVWSTPDSKNAICQHDYIAEKEIKRYIQPVQMIETPDSLYIRFVIVNNLNENVSGSFVYVPANKQLPYYHRLDLKVDDNNGSITSKTLAGKINAYTNRGSKLYYKTENQKFNEILSLILDNWAIKDALHKERGAGVYPMYVIYNKSTSPAFQLKSFNVDTSSVVKTDFETRRSELKITGCEYDKWDNEFKIKLSYNNRLKISVKASPSNDKDGWKLSNILIKVED